MPTSPSSVPAIVGPWRRGLGRAKGLAAGLEVLPVRVSRMGLRAHGPCLFGAAGAGARVLAPGEKWAHFKLPLSVPGGSKKGPLNPHFKPPLSPLNRLLNPHHRF